MTCSLCHHPHGEGAPCPPVPRDLTAYHRVFTARYPGRCRACDQPINVGDLTVFVDDLIVHQECR